MAPHRKPSIGAPDREFLVVYTQDDDGVLVMEQSGFQTREGIVRDVIDAQFDDIAFIVRFNAVEKRSEDVTAEIADAVIEHCRMTGESLWRDAVSWCGDLLGPSIVPLWADTMEGGRFVGLGDEGAA